MEKSQDNKTTLKKQAVYQGELNKLTDIFKEVEESKRRLCEGLIEDAAFLKAEDYILKQSIKETGMIKVHPDHPDMQKPIPAAKEYRQNLNSYAVVIKTLNGVLSKNIIDEDDEDLNEYE